MRQLVLTLSLSIQPYKIQPYKLCNMSLPAIPHIIYQDQDLLILDKPNGQLSVPGKAVQPYVSLQEQVQRTFPTATCVHRLDMATSGLLLMALNKTCHRHLSQQFEQRLIEKKYQAQVFGHLITQQGTIDLPLICDWPNRPKQKVDFVLGKNALTHWRVLEEEQTSTRVELIPITGRSHQLRVHMQNMGHPILGDALYAHDQAFNMATRLQLHACYLALQHPSSLQRLSFESPAPF